MIIAQHHAAYDGSGFPKRLKGSQIYDLAHSHKFDPQKLEPKKNVAGTFSFAFATGARGVVTGNADPKIDPKRPPGVGVAACQRRLAAGVAR